MWDWLFSLGRRFSKVDEDILVRKARFNRSAEPPDIRKMLTPSQLTATNNGEREV